MRASLVLGILLTASLFVQAQDKKVDPKKKAPPEPKTWMTKKGELLWEQKWEGTEWPKDWNKGKGNWQVDSGQLKSAEVPADAHQAYASHPVKEINAIIQFSFKFDGAKGLGAFFDGNGQHISALSFGAENFAIRKMSGIGPTTKSTEMDSSKAKLNDGAWHTVVWEIYGNEMVATIDDKDMVLGKADDLSSERAHVELNSSGGQWALFKDVKVWKAEMDDKWPKKRDFLIQSLKKKPAAIGYK